MNSKSGTSNQVNSLPQGGGALQGIGETFSPGFHSEAANSPGASKNLDCETGTITGVTSFIAGI